MPDELVKSPEPGLFVDSDRRSHLGGTVDLVVRVAIARLDSHVDMGAEFVFPKLDDEALGTFEAGLIVLGIEGVEKGPAHGLPFLHFPKAHERFGESACFSGEFHDVFLFSFCPGKIPTRKPPYRKKIVRTNFRVECRQVVMKDPKDTRLEIRIEHELLRRLRKAAEREGVSVAELLRRAADKIAA